MDTMKSLMVNQCSLTGKAICVFPIISFGAVFPLSKITAKSAGFLLRAENTVFNSHATACFRFMSANKIDLIEIV